MYTNDSSNNSKIFDAILSEIKREMTLPENKEIKEILSRLEA
jgi:hypothetical protein